METIEVFAVEPNQVGAINNQPEKSIRSLLGLIYHCGGQTVVGGEVSTDKATGWLIWVKRADRNTQNENPESCKHQFSELVWNVHELTCRAYRGTLPEAAALKTIRLC